MLNLIQHPSCNVNAMAVTVLWDLDPLANGQDDGTFFNLFVHSEKRSNEAISANVLP